MTVSLYLANITNAIESISISGVTVMDKDEISPSWLGQPNVLYPNPNNDGFVTNFNIRFDSVLQGTNAPMTIGYTLNYRFLGTQVGDLSSFTLAYSNVIDKVVAIINAVIAVPAPYSGRVELIVSGVSIGAVADPAGNAYHGADLSFAITEMQN